MIENKELAINDTKAIKGFALLLLLFHHLFYENNGLYSDFIIGNKPIIQLLALQAEVCVCFFVFLSGYGLVKKISKQEFNTKSFYKYEYLKLFKNYWFIFLIFVPIYFLCFGFNPSDYYGKYWIIAFILDFFGLISFTSLSSLNPTWWFLSCIIGLYALFPILYKREKKTEILICGISFILCLPQIWQKIPFIKPFSMYILPFELGIIFSKYSLFSKLSEYFSKESILLWLFVLVLFRITNLVSWFILDSFIVIFFCLFFSNMKQGIRQKIQPLFIFLGNQSMNIFYFHTFIYYFWFSKLVYYSKSPIIILFVCLFVCFNCLKLHKKLIFQFNEKRRR